MASNIATILIKLETQTADFKTKLTTAGKQMETFGKKTVDSTAKAEKGFKGLQEKLRNTAGGIAAVQGPLGPFAGRLNALGAIIGRVTFSMLIFTAATAGTLLVMKKMVAAVSNSERQFGKLTAILKATGGAAGLTLSDIEDLSQKIGIETLASVQGVRDAAGIMLTFKSITGDTFREALTLAQDLAEVGFGDLKTASTQLGKALEDPIAGLGALKRVGVSFTDQQKETIRVLTMTGRKAEAQTIILKALKTQLGESGPEAAKGFAGAVDSLGERFNIFFEQATVGIKITEGLTWAIQGLADAFANTDKEASTFQGIKQVEKEIERIQKQIDKKSEEAKGSILGLDEEDTRLAFLQEHIQTFYAQLKKLREEEEKAKDKINSKKAIQEINDLAELRKKNNKEFIKQNQHEIEGFGKTESELRLHNKLYEIQEKLFKELKSTSADAQEQVREQMEETTPIIIEQNKLYEEAANRQRDLDAVAKGVGDTFSSVGDKISDAMFRGKLATLNFKDILLEAVIALQKMVFKVLVLDEIQRKIEERIKGSKGFSLGDIFGAISGAFGGNGGAMAGDGYASGGTVQANTPSLVGERGPELFVPNSSGKIVNGSDTRSAMSGGSGVNITQNLNFTVGITNTVRAEVMNMLPAIQQSTLNAVAEAKQRGGKFSKAFG
jgi:uncharacterized protein YoxC/uncharacterized small protein (DUF1192 family)